MNDKSDGIPIRYIGADETIAFAASELARYLSAMIGCTFAPERAGEYKAGSPGFWLGLAGSFGKAVPARIAGTGSIFDDAVFVSSKKRHVILAGANARSVLYAAYRCLEEMGCRWFRPGGHGERVPAIADPLTAPIRICETPSARHRVICIEGSCSEEHVRNMLDYSAKRGFNAYMIQFRNAFTFWDRWYSAENPAGPEKFTPAKADAICARIKKEALRRGLLLHTVGHGWTCEPFGISGNEWKPTTQKIPPSARKYFAEIKGKRELWGGIPLNTNLCYSRKEVRTIMARAVAGYAASHRDEKVVHVWLGDGMNNNCECPGCQKALPADFYVMLLNEIDRLLSAGCLETRIVFLAYVDLLWAPLKQRLANPDRFILMFAPITRSYSRAFLDAKGPKEKAMPFKRNELTFPRSPEANLKLLSEWRRAFKGDCVDFDYHLWGDWILDPGQVKAARVLHADLAGLERLGMRGFISCQSQRPFYPTGLLMEIMGRTLWDKTAGFDRLADEYFKDLFGGQGAGVRKYLENISRHFDSRYLRGERPSLAARRGAVAGWQKIAGIIDSMRPVIIKGMKDKDKVRAAAWKILDAHGHYTAALAKVHLARELRDAKRLGLAWKHFSALLDRQCRRHHQVFDFWTARVKSYKPISHE